MKKIRNTQIAERLLESLLACPLATLDIVASVRLGKPWTLRALHEFQMHPQNKPSNKVLKSVKETRLEYIRYHSFLKRLKSQGLVTQSGQGKSKYWLITAVGKRMLKRFKKQNTLLKEAITPGGTTIISYDIPERIHAERDAMRELLKLFGFNFIHQSLWYANATVEKQFIDYLRERKLLDYVHIFQVSKSGTLETVTQ